MSDQLYANGRIAVMSTKLLGTDKFTRLAECSSVVEALKVLSECGYGNGVAISHTNDYEQLLTAELDLAMALLRELCYDKNAVSYFLCRYNYHNAKVLMKSKYMRTDGVGGCFENAGIAPAQMQESFVNDDYSLCTRNMAEACDQVDSFFADGVRSPQIVDKCLDKAMFAEMHSYAKKCSIPLVRKLFDWEVNSTNLMLLYRLKKAALDKDSLEDWLVQGGTVKKNILQKLWDSDSAAVDLPEKYRKFYNLCNLSNVNLVAAEAAVKAERNSIIADCADALTIQPVVDYFYKKVDEIDKVRFVLINIKNGTDKDKIKSAIL